MKFIIDHLDTIVTIITTAVGFIITILLTKKSYKDEVKKSKIAIGADAMKEIPVELCKLMDGAAGLSKGTPITAEKYADLISRILSYGSKDAVSIAVHMQQLAFSNRDGQDEQKKWEALVAYALLITQIKYDLTSEVISPESWFKMKITDYETMRPVAIKMINELVDSLNLNKEFMVKK